MTRQLSGYRVARRLPLESDQDYVVLCTGDKGTQKLAAWTLGDAHVVNLNVTANDGTALPMVSGKGERSVAKVYSGKLTLELTGLPRYLTLDGVRLAGK